MTTAPKPTRQTLGTAYNLRPTTSPVCAGDLLPGHVVMESHEHPAQITRIVYPSWRLVRIYARYIWSAASEPDWVLGTFHRDSRIPTAKKGQY